MSHDSESDRIATWMQKLSVDSPEQSHRPLPDPDLIWMKAQLLDRQAAMRRSMKPVEWFETIARLLVGFSICWLALGWTKVLTIPGSELTVSVVLAALAMVTYPIWAGDQ